jgi:Ca2+-binding RTX toxin-like protein
MDLQRTRNPETTAARPRPYGRGGVGNDIYLVERAGDAVTKNPGEGTDPVQSSITHALRANLENLTLTGIGNINGTGNAADNVITGNNGNNVLVGLGGADTLDGGVGTDTASYAASAVSASGNGTWRGC